jgi:hypothetical protein
MQTPPSFVRLAGFGSRSDNKPRYDEGAIHLLLIVVSYLTSKDKTLIPMI